MLNETSTTEPAAVQHAAGPPTRSGSHSSGTALRSATRPLEVMELFAVRRRPLSVSEIASALDIPQSSSSILLQAMKRAGFVARDRETRKYLPSVRSVLLSNWVHDVFHERGSLLQALDELSAETQATVRLGVRNGIHVQYMHVSWPAGGECSRALGPGMKLPVGSDSLGRMLLIAESETDICRIIRHSNAAGDVSPKLDVEAVMRELRRNLADGFAEYPDLTEANEVVLAVQLPFRFGAVTAIGLGLEAGRLPAERTSLLQMLGEFSARSWFTGPTCRNGGGGISECWKPQAEHRTGRRAT